MQERDQESDVSITSRMQEIEERISDVEDTREQTDTTKRMQKAPNPKHPGNLGHNKKAKPKDNRYKTEQRILI